MVDIGRTRQEYLQKGLSRKGLDDNPCAQFEIWYQQAEEAKHPYSNAMSLATVGKDLIIGLEATSCNTSL